MRKVPGRHARYKFVRFGIENRETENGAELVGMETVERSFKSLETSQPVRAAAGNY